MQKLELESEVIQISTYSNIVLSILNKHHELSINKILFFAYLIKEEKYRLGKVYTANNKQDVVCKAISLISGDYIEYCESIKFILKAIHLLINNRKIEINGTIISRKNIIKHDEIMYQESAFIEKAIEESRKMSDKQFMKEVVANV